jgi:hypothetical protein
VTIALRENFVSSVGVKVAVNMTGWVILNTNLIAFTGRLVAFEMNMAIGYDVTMFRSYLLRL